MNTSAAQRLSHHHIDGGVIALDSCLRDSKVTECDLFRKDGGSGAGRFRPPAGCSRQPACRGFPSTKKQGFPLQTAPPPLPNILQNSFGTNRIASIWTQCASTNFIADQGWLCYTDPFASCRPTVTGPAYGNR